MSTTQSQLDYILDQLSFLPQLEAKKMFGEYGLYCSGKYFALVCDNKLFLKTSKDLVQKIGDDGLRAYAGSKNSLHVPEELLEDKDYLKTIVKVF
jgi:TfoX/Sxy family transcriptional regulator of competence genes